jgi:hypothetical protein
MEVPVHYQVRLLAKLAGILKSSLQSASRSIGANIMAQENLDLIKIEERHALTQITKVVTF